jgi:hypothetical protein
MVVTLKKVKKKKEHKFCYLNELGFKLKKIQKASFNSLLLMLIRQEKRSKKDYFLISFTKIVYIYF